MSSLDSFKTRSTISVNGDTVDVGHTRSQTYALIANYGVTDRITEDTFLTVTGVAPPYLPFTGLQPDDFFGQDCVRWGDGGGIDDIDCSDNQLGYVCECDGVAPDPAAY